MKRLVEILELSFNFLVGKSDSPPTKVGGGLLGSTVAVIVQNPIHPRASGLLIY